MRVFIYGDNSPGSGGGCYAEAFRRAGHDVLAHSDWHGLETYATNLRKRLIRKITRRVLESDRRRHVAGLSAAARDFRPDILIVLKGLHLEPEDVVALKAFGSWVPNVNHDDFFSRYRLSWSAAQRRAIPKYDYVLTTREVNVDEVRPLNPRVEFFPFAYDPNVHRPVPIPPAEEEVWRTDVTFVGTYAPHRAWMLERLVSAVPARYAIFGGGWKYIRPWSPLRRYLRRREVYRDDMAKALGGAKISLGFLRKENRDDYTQRSFEIPACGGLLLAERTHRHLTFYREGEEAEFFDPNSPAELIENVRSLLTDENRRERIRSAGQAAVARQGHTYGNRIDRLLTLYWQAQS